MKINFLKESLILAIIFLPIIFMLAVWNKLPDSIPTHWNLKGEVDGWGPKYMYALIAVGMYVLFLIIPKIDPRKRNYTFFSATYYKLRLILMLFISLLSSLVMFDLLYVRVDFTKLLPASILFLLALIGNYLTTVRSNFFIGIRTPWTLDNEEVWRKTHLVGGRLWFFGGIAGGILTLILPYPASQYFAIGVVGCIVLTPLVYSYFSFRKLEKRAAN